MDNFGAAFLRPSQVSNHAGVADFQPSGQKYSIINQNNNQLNYSNVFSNQDVTHARDLSSSALDFSNKFNQSGVAGGRDDSRVMDLLSQVDALNATDENDLDDLAKYDMNMAGERAFDFNNDEEYVERNQDDFMDDRDSPLGINDGGQNMKNNSRLFLESFDRDSDLLDDKDLLELQAAQSILEECGLSSGKKLVVNRFSHLSQTNAEVAGQLNKVTEEAYDQDDKLRKSMGQIEDF